MKTTSKASICLFFILFFSFSVLAYPTVTEHVTDLAHLLSPDEIKLLTDQCQGIEDRTTVEIAILTVPDTGGEDRTIYANRVGDQSGVGKTATDNGLVVMWSMDNEKGGAIATGRGIESIFNDAKVGRIGRASRPFFDNGKYYDGFKTILDVIDAELEPQNGTDTNSSSSTISDNTTTTSSVPVIFIIIFIIIILLILISGAMSSGGGSYSGGSSYIGHSSWGSGSSGGFGGGSFGGGGSSF
jgi:uncharacterized protein